MRQNVTRGVTVLLNRGDSCVPPVCIFGNGRRAEAVFGTTSCTRYIQQPPARYPPGTITHWHQSQRIIDISLVMLADDRSSSCFSASHLCDIRHNSANWHVLRLISQSCLRSANPFAHPPIGLSRRPIGRCSLASPADTPASVFSARPWPVQRPTGWCSLASPADTPASVFRARP